MKYSDHPQFNDKVKPSLVAHFKAVAQSVLNMTDPSTPEVSVTKKVIETDNGSLAATMTANGYGPLARTQEAVDFYNKMKEARPLAQAIMDNW